MKSMMFYFALIFLALSKPSYAGAIPGLEGPFIDVVDGKIQVSVTLSKFEMPAYLGVRIPKLPNSSFELQPNALDTGSIAVVKIDPTDLKIVSQVVMDRGFVLPDGRPIPGIPGGKLKPSLRLDLKPEQKSISFYYHEAIFGFYIPLNLNYNFPVTSAGIKLNWKGKKVGTLMLIGREGEKKAAILIFVQHKAILENPEMMAKVLASKK
jgi:hypothetical protein